MARIFYYPSYTPSRRHLRSLLMIYDSVTTMVPLVDQRHVLERDHVQEVRAANDELFGFFDPSQVYPAWQDDQETLKAFKRLADRHRSI